MAEIKIDSRLFQERVSHFASAWKNDLRANNGLFHDAQSLLIMMGKVEEVPELHKNNAMHVGQLDPSTRIPRPRIANWLCSSGCLDTNSRPP